MISSALYQDLINDFKKQDELLDEQVATFEPITESLRQPAAYRLLHKSFLILLEGLCYIMLLGAIAFAVMLKHIVPFYIISTLNERGESSGFPINDVTLLYWGTIGMALIIGILFFFIARLIRKIRLKNNVLHIINKNIRVLLAHHLQRKAAIDTIEKRHFSELPSLQPTPTSVNDIPNPGHDAN